MKQAVLQREEALSLNKNKMRRSSLEPSTLGAKQRRPNQILLKKKGRKEERKGREERKGKKREGKGKKGEKRKDKRREKRKDKKKKKEKERKGKGKKSPPGESAEILLPSPRATNRLSKTPSPSPTCSLPLLQTLCSIILHLSRKSLEIFGNEIMCHYPSKKRLKIAHKLT